MLINFQLDYLYNGTILASAIASFFGVFKFWEELLPKDAL